MRFDINLIGVGYHFDLEWYFIFSDGTKSDPKSNQKLKYFEELYIKPEDAVIRSIRL